MANVVEAQEKDRNFKFGVIVSRFNEWVTRSLLDGALNELRRAGVSEGNITVIWVPGTFEIPVACRSLCETSRPDGLIALGCIIRGETTHYEHIAQSDVVSLFLCLSLRV